MRAGTTPLLAASLLLLLTTAAWGGSITIAADHPVKISYRVTGGGEYRDAAGVTPLVLEVDDNRTYDIRAEGEAGLFSIYRAEQLKATAGDYIALPLTREPDWKRILLVVAAFCAFVMLAWLAWWLRSRGRERQMASALDSERRERERAAFATAVPGRLGHYTVLERIGEGGMASVYRAEDEFGDCYALKVPSPRVFEDESFRERFVREMKMGQSLHHPALVKVYEFSEGSDSAVPYIAMELLTGGTLKDLLRRKGVLTPREALDILIPVTEGLEAAHRQGVIHRDLKPGNIMLDGQGSPRLMDFGMARSAALATLTATDMMLGTPAYMAPEQLNSKAVDPRADLYALGVILFELLTGRLPFEGRESHQIIAMKHAKKAPLPSKVRPGVPAALDALIAKLLEKSPKNRLASAQQLLDRMRPLRDTLS